MLWLQDLSAQDREQRGDYFSTRTDPRAWQPAVGDMGGHVASISVLLSKELEGLRPMNDDTLDAYFKAWVEKRAFYPSELSGPYDDCVAIYLKAWPHVQEAVRAWLELGDLRNKPNMEERRNTLRKKYREEIEISKSFLEQGFECRKRAAEKARVAIETGAVPPPPPGQPLGPVHEWIPPRRGHRVARRPNTNRESPPLFTPPAHAATPAPPYHALNSMPAGGLRRARLHVPDLAGYRVFPIETVTVINSYDPANDHYDPSGQNRSLSRRPGHPAPDPRIDRIQGFDVVANGSFASTLNRGKGRTSVRNPVVPVMRKGHLDNMGYHLTWNRGGVAVLNDGTIVVARQMGAPANGAFPGFGTRENPVRDFMGGGALLIENGNPVPIADILDVQQFKQGIGNLNANQFRPAFHTLVGIRQQQAFLIVSPHDASGGRIQHDLTSAGFSSAVMFDGGSGFLLRSPGWSHTKGNNPLGLGIMIRRR